MMEIGPGHKWTGREISPTERVAILIRGAFKCAYCGEDMSDPDFPTQNVTIDHLIARKSGGPNTATNLVPACRSCNSRKGQRDWEDYAPGGSQDRIIKQLTKPLNLQLAALVMAGQVPTDEDL